MYYSEAAWRSRQYVLYASNVMQSYPNVYRIDIIGMGIQVDVFLVSKNVYIIENCENIIELKEFR